MQGIIFVIILLIVVLILMKAGAKGGFILGFVNLVIPLLVSGGTAGVVGIVGSAVLTPFLGIPLAIITFFYILRRFL